MGLSEWRYLQEVMIHAILHIQKCISTGQMFKHLFMLTVEEKNGWAIIGSRYCVEALGLPVKSPWRSWFHNKQVPSSFSCKINLHVIWIFVYIYLYIKLEIENFQVGGRIVEYEGLTLVTVRGAGHLVPLNKPSEALALIHSFLSDEPLPNHR